jgi:hypothetical protein
MRRVTPLDPARNPGFLKLDLLCRGARVDDAAEFDRRGGRPVMRTRAGLGSGLELVLDEGLRVNVPVVEPFAARSPYEVRPAAGRSPGAVDIVRDGAPCARARLAARPRWYDRPTSAGRPMRRVGTLQGTYLAIYPGRVCDFWVKGVSRTARENCRFCSVGLNLGADDASGKTVDEVLEVVHAARRESGITYVDFNAGHDDGFGFLDALEPFVRRVKEETGLLVGIQTPPHPDPARWERLKALGVNRVSFCFEIFDPERFRAICPGKARVYGLETYLESITRCARLARRERRSLEPWVVNGEIIAGLEPAASSIAAVRWLTGQGAIPTVCIFRPLVGTDLALAPSPTTEDVLPVFQALWTECMAHGLPIGLAPNVRVSLVMLPEECRWLIQDERILRRFASRERTRVLRKGAFAVALRARRLLRVPRPRAAAAVAP